MPLEGDAAYTCPFCFEQNYLGVDPSGGRRQDLIEDCPVCCNPIQFVVIVDADGDATITDASPAS
jgi:hypothetical protein